MTGNADDGTFHTKSFPSEVGSKSIVLQNENGPCALVALVNVLALRDTPMAACVNNEQAIVDEEVLKLKLGEIASQLNASSENMDSLFEFMPKLSKGLDVNPKFDGTFAPSRELGLFQAFAIPLVHTWVLGPLERAELGITDDKLSELSYEQMCALQFSDSPVPELGSFLQQYPSQMTLSGLDKLTSLLKDDEFAVMFWNNHFSTIVKRNNKLYSLVTDLGFQKKQEIVWEEVNVRGAGDFFNGEFRPSNDREKADAVLALHLAEEERGRSASTAPISIPSQPENNSFKKVEPKTSVAEGPTGSRPHPESTVMSKPNPRTTKSKPDQKASKAKLDQKKSRCCIA